MPLISMTTRLFAKGRSAVTIPYFYRFALKLNQSIQKCISAVRLSAFIHWNKLQRKAGLKVMFYDMVALH